MERLETQSTTIEPFSLNRKRERGLEVSGNPAVSQHPPHHSTHPPFFSSFFSPFFFFFFFFLSCFFFFFLVDSLEPLLQERANDETCNTANPSSKACIQLCGTGRLQELAKKEMR